MQKSEANEMLIIDGDYPMAHGGMGRDRDLTQTIDRVRAAPFEQDTAGRGHGETLASLPEMRKGKIAVALVKVVGCVKRPVHHHGDHCSDEIAYGAAQGQLAYYRILETKGETRILETRGDFSSHMATWSEATEYDDLPVGMVLGMEGADPILWPEQARQWWDQGLRVASLSHYGVSRYSHGTGTGTDGGLFPETEPLLREMESLGMILDVSHTSDESIRQALDLFSGPVLSSHQNCRAVVPGERQLPDDLLQRIIDRGAVIGSSMDTWMLNRHYQLDWGSGKIPNRRTLFPREAVTLEDYADNIDHVCQMAGNSFHAAIGGDTDGQSGREGAPYEIDTVADYQKVGDVLAKRGYADEDVANVMHRNWQRFFEKWLPA
jgi:membrane dipeptidase